MRWLAFTMVVLVVLAAFRPMPAYHAAEEEASEEELDRDELNEWYRDTWRPAYDEPDLTPGTGEFKQWLDEAKRKFPPPLVLPQHQGAKK